jgi:beta-phosphoglucomutase
MLQAVIFDFDGVITDSEILHFRAFNKVLTQHGLELTKKEYYSKYLGLSDVDCYNTLIDEGKLALEKSQVKTLVQKKTRIFEELARTDGKIIEGVREFLHLLAAEKVRTAICSGALRAEIELILEDAKLRSFFEAIVSAEEVKRGKPHPDGFLLALKRLNANGVTRIAAQRCVVIEDSHWGLQAAQAAGMQTIAVTNTYEAEQLAGAGKIVACLDALTMKDLEQLCPS